MALAAFTLVTMAAAAAVGRFIGSPPHPRAPLFLLIFTCLLRALAAG
jgi:hypothetical protein